MLPLQMGVCMTDASRMSGGKVCYLYILDGETQFSINNIFGTRPFRCITFLLIDAAFLQYAIHLSLAYMPSWRIDVSALSILLSIFEGHVLGVKAFLISFLLDWLECVLFSYCHKSWSIIKRTISRAILQMFSICLLFLVSSA